MASKKCHYCEKIFFDTSTKNRHIKKVHQKPVEDLRENHIFCPLCEKEELVALGTYTNLNKHLTVTHKVSINEVNITFSNKQEYENWLKNERIEVNYLVVRKKKLKEELTEVHYVCNRSNRIGYTSKYNIRTEKAGGSIKMQQGVCPSRIIVKLDNGGNTSIAYFKTHVGHEEDIRCQHLSKIEENIIAEKLKIGITADRILSDARNLRNGNKLNRFNMLSRKDLNNLTKKHNINKRRHENDMVTIRAHKLAEKMDQNIIKEVGFGEFQVRSSKAEVFYNITYNEICEEACRTMYCRVCKICIHRYKCECQQYAVKTTLCKHIHLVYMFEKARGTNSVLGDVVEKVSVESSQINQYHQKEIQEFIQEKKSSSEAFNFSGNEEDVRRIGNQEVVNFLNSLDFETYMTTVKNILKTKAGSDNASRKRKMDTQVYYPSKK